GAIQDALKAKAGRNTQVTLLTPKTMDINGAMTKAAKVVIDSMGIPASSTLYDQKGHQRNKYVPHNRLSDFVQKINKAEVRADLYDLLPHVMNDAFSGNSLLLSDHTFVGVADDDKKNTKKLNLEYKTAYMMADVDVSSGFARGLTKLSPKQRYQAEINQNISGRYYAISSVDSNTEWMLDLGEFVETDATKKGKLSRYVVDIFRGYLIDEMNLIDDSAQRIESNKTL